MILKIKNKLPIAETGLLSLVFLGGINNAIYQIITISHLATNPYTTPFFWVGVLATLGLLLFALNQRKKHMGVLLIDTDSKTFSLNNSPMLKFSELTEYSSKLSSPKRSRLSAMSIKLGTKDNGSFSIIDADRFYFMPKGRSEEEIHALNLLVKDSSLNTEQKTSYENWAGRASLVNL